MAAKKAKASAKKKRKSSLPLRLILLLLLLGLGYQLVSVQAQVKQARQQEAEKAQMVQQLKEENAAIAADIERAQDPELLEDLARSELGMGYSDEKVFIDSNG